MSSTREKEVILDVLNKYKEMPYLWQKSHKEYTNKDKRDTGAAELLSMYREFDENATLKFIKKKLLNMRTSYFKELKKVKNAQGSGKVYVPTLFYFNALSFLGDNGYCARDTESDEEHSSSPSSDVESVYQQKPTSSKNQHPRKKQRTQPIETRASNSEATEYYLQMRDEKWEAIGRSIGLQLRDLEKGQQTVAHKLINDVMYYAETGVLSPDCSISLGNGAGEILHVYDSFSRETKPRIRDPLVSTML